MVNKSRVAQYMPMDALKGLREALREKEEMVEHQKLLFEESKEKINQTLMNLKVGDKVEVLYYEKGRYIQLRGIIEFINSQELCINSTVFAISVLYYIDVL